MAGPGRPRICVRRVSTASVSDFVSAALIRRRFVALTRSGSPLAVVPRKAATTRTLEVDHACEVDTCDVTDADQVAAYVARVVERFGRIDVLVNNVGRSAPGGPVELDPQAWEDQMAVNLRSAYLLCHEVLPVMERAGRGAVVSIASVAGLRYIGKPQVGYAAAKAALLQFTRTTGVIYARRGVRLGAITTGAYVLARAGLLDGYACTIHWENATSFAADFPDIELRNNLYVIDRDRYSCSGAKITFLGYSDGCQQACPQGDAATD